MEDYVALLEADLTRSRPGGWTRLTGRSLQPYRQLNIKAAWRIEVPAGTVSAAGVDHLLVLVDRDFPNSEPRIVVPQVEPLAWPHVERQSIICLPGTPPLQSPAERVLLRLHDAIVLLQYSEAQREEDFAREFQAYWSQKADSKNAPAIRALVKPDGNPRSVAYYWDRANRFLVFAENEKALQRWLENTGRKLSRKQFHSSYLAWMTPPPPPLEFPKIGADILDQVGPDFLQGLAIPGQPFPLLIGANTATGSVLAAVLIQGMEAKVLQKGFRGIDRVPFERILKGFKSRPVVRCEVQRVDPDWVHGRDHNEEQARLRTKKVAIIGCGAVGGYVTRLLIQAGVGNFIFVDNDVLASHNTSRHVLGNQYVGVNKAFALKQAFLEEFPHIEPLYAIPERFQGLSEAQLQAISGCDLIVTAGLDAMSELAVNAWRLKQATPPPCISAWTEEYALAGHAVALFGDADISTQMDESGVARFHVTQWTGVETTQVEAGCGNTFQPHGAVDLQGTVGLSARLCLDVLTGATKSSLRRVWLGSRDAVINLGGTPGAQFSGSYQQLEFLWVPGSSNA